MTKTAIVTGGSRGIGAAIARRLSADGFALIINYARGRDEAEALARELGNAKAVQADLADPRAMITLFDAAESGVDVLVNNGGIMQLAPIAETSDELFERTLAINLGGTFRGMREAAKRMRERGRVINFSSSVVGLYQPTYGAYAASKAAVEAMTHIVAKELGAKGITVNAIAPGPTETAMFMDGKPKRLVDTIIDMNPQKRLGQVDDIARVVSFLASPESQWVSGQTLRVNGGVV